jgi:hypothetical protein
MQLYLILTRSLALPLKNKLQEEGVFKENGYLLRE